MLNLLEEQNRYFKELHIYLYVHVWFLNFIGI